MQKSISYFKKSETGDISFERPAKIKLWHTHNENKIFLVYFYLPQISVSIRV
jgi:hypothetical protein